MKKVRLLVSVIFVLFMIGVNVQKTFPSVHASGETPYAVIEDYYASVDVGSYLQCDYKLSWFKEGDILKISLVDFGEFEFTYPLRFMRKNLVGDGSIGYYAYAELSIDIDYTNNRLYIEELRVGEGKVYIDGSDIVTQPLHSTIIEYVHLIRPSFNGIPPMSFDLEEVENGGFTNQNVTVRYNSDFSEFGYIMYAVNGEGVDDELINGQQFTNEGLYQFIMVDMYNGIVEAEFTIDKTSPQIVFDINEGETQETTVFTRDLTIQYSDNYNITSAVYCKDNGEEVSFESGMTFTENGTYIITIGDAAGNVATKTFTISKPTLPTYTLIGVTEGGYTKGSVNVDYDETLAFAMYERYDVNRNCLEEGIELLSTTVLSSEGYYVVYLYGINGGVVEITFTIDKTVPTILLNNGQLNAGGSASSVKVTFSDNYGIANANYSFGGSMHTLENGMTFTAKGSYSIIIQDVAGNRKMITFKVI